MTNTTSYTKKIILTLAIIITAIIGENYKTHYVDPQPFESASNQLGIANPSALLKALYYSETLTQENLWTNLKRINTPNKTKIWKHATYVIQNHIEKNHDFKTASKNFFGTNLSILDKLLGNNLLIDSDLATKLIIAQSQEFFGQKAGQERNEAFGQPISEVEIDENILSALIDLGLIKAIDPTGEENIIAIPGASLQNFIARLAYVKFLVNQNIIKPDQIIITAGDRTLTPGLDSLENSKIKNVKNALHNSSVFSDIREVLLKPDLDSRETIFQELTTSIQKFYEKHNLEVHSGVKGVHDWETFPLLSESGGSYYIIHALGLDQLMYYVTHTPKYEDGRRPDTESTAVTFAKYYFDNLYKKNDPNNLGIASNQPYSPRQGEIFKTAIIKEAESREIDPKTINFSVFGFEYDHGDAKRPLSELATAIAERAKNDFSLEELNPLMYRTRTNITSTRRKDGLDF